MELPNHQYTDSGQCEGPNRTYLDDRVTRGGLIAVFNKGECLRVKIELKIKGRKACWNLGLYHYRSNRAAILSTYFIYVKYCTRHRITTVHVC